jgi:hypothetical protein
MNFKFIGKQKLITDWYPEVITPGDVITTEDERTIRWLESRNDFKLKAEKKKQDEIPSESDAS